MASTATARVLGVTVSDEHMAAAMAADEWMPWIKANGAMIRANQIRRFVMTVPIDELGTWVVLDDLDIPVANLVRTDGEAGLTVSDAGRAIAILKGQPK